MSKSSSNDDINIAYLEKLADAVSDAAISMQKISESYGSSGQLEQTLKNLAKSVNDGNMTTKQLLKEAASAQKNIRGVEYGLEDTAKYNKTVNMFIKLLEEKIGNSTIDDVLVKKLTTAFENLDVTAILESEKIGQRGGKGAPLKNVMDNEKLNKVNEDLAKRIGVSLDSTADKLMMFFQEQEEKKEKKQKGLIDDLIEGLEKSKWVGGALRDTFKLVGLLGANWLSQFGQLGRILGGAFYVAMETFGPHLAKLLVEGIFRGTVGLSKALWGLVGGIGSLIGGAAANLIYKSGGPILDLMTAPTAAGKAAALGKVGGGLGAITAGGWAIGQGIDSWKQGRRGNAAALGIGGAGLLAGGAAVLAGVAAPITVPLIAISGAVAGIAALWKYHSETIKKWAGKFLEFMNKAVDFFAMFSPVFKAIQWIRDNWPFGGKGTGGFVGGNNQNRGTGITDSIIDNAKGNYVTYGKMKVSKRDGSILNLSELTQAEASQALQMYEKADPTSFNRVYEWVGGDKASLASHSTDAVKMEGGKVVAALSKKGTSNEIEALRGLLVGMSPEKAAQLVQTSGKLTGSNTQHAVGGWKSHNNPYALGIDLAGGSSWTGEDYEKNLPVLRDYYDKLGFSVNLERPGQGKSTGWHYDIKPKTNFRPEGARENFVDYEKAKSIKSTDEMMTVAEVIKNLPEEDKQKFREEVDKKKSSTPEQWEEILKGMGIYKSQALQGNPWVKETDGNTSLLKDASGNYMFSTQYMQKIANTGVN